MQMVDALFVVLVIMIVVVIVVVIVIVALGIEIALGMLPALDAQLAIIVEFVGIFALGRRCVGRTLATFTFRTAPPAAPATTLRPLAPFARRVAVVGTRVRPIEVVFRRL